MYRYIIISLLLFSCQEGSHSKQETKAVPTSGSLTKEAVKDTTAAVPDETINSQSQPIKLISHPVQLQTGDSFNLQIPEGYRLSIAAQGLKRLRFLAMSPDNRLFATDMYDRSDNHKGRVLIFENWDDSTKSFRKISTYLDGLHNPNQVAFYKNYLYVAETDRLSRYVYHPGLILPTDTGAVIARFPAYGLGYKYGGWHLTRSLAFHNDKLYVSVGSSCNACVETEEIRASILEMDLDGGNITTYARGLRNSVGIQWIGNKLWVTGMGRDLIGPDKPEDLFQQVEKDGYYGWPYYFQYQGKIYPDTQFADSAKPSWVKEPPVAFCGFKAHSAPLGFTFLKNFEDPVLRNSVLVCLHGSTSVWRERGNAVVKVEADNKYTNIVTGFLTGKTDADRHGRPCDVLMKDEHSFFVTDDLKGVLYYIYK